MPGLDRSPRRGRSTANVVYDDGVDVDAVLMIGGVGGVRHGDII